MLTDGYVPVPLEEALRYVVVPPLDDTGRAEGGQPGLEGILGQRQQTLADILHHIQTEMALRKQISRRIAREALQQYRYVKSKLFAMDAYPLGPNRAWEMRRSALEQELDGLNKEHRSEQAACFQDIAKLTAEWRTWFKQYRDAVLRMRLVQSRLK